MKLVAAVLELLAYIILAIAIVCSIGREHFNTQTALLWVIALTCAARAMKDN